MFSIRHSTDIHEEDGGWFQARWHFSFDHYNDPRQMGVGPLRVFNDDRIVAGAEWPMHPHRDIESLTYVVEGEFLHADSLGNDGRLRAGGAQVMSFSHSGAEHSERNGSATEPLRFLQFWILPSRVSGTSSVQQRQYSVEDRLDRWLQIMSPPGEEGLDLRQDAFVKVSRLNQGQQLDFCLPEERVGYLYVIDGDVGLDGQKAGTGDAATVIGPHSLTVDAITTAELIGIDVPQHYEPVGVWAGRA